MEPDKEHSVLSSSCSCTSLLGPNEPRAPIEIVSPARRDALITCLESGACIAIAGHGFQQPVITAEGASLA
jgi:hypothetical protein